MAFYGDTDIPAMLQDVGVPFAAGGVTGQYGILNLQDKVIVHDAERGEVHATVPSVEVQVSAFPVAALAIDAPVTVNGVNYYIRDHDASADGALLKLWLRKA
jgi:hypothetical protein